MASSILTQPAPTTPSSSPRPTALAPTASLEDVANWFNTVYSSAAGDVDRLPWRCARANSAFVAWMNARAPELIRPGARVAVIGCGIGHEAVEVARRGYEVLAFDICESAISWAKQLFPAEASIFQTHDAMDLPSRFRHRFDLVVDVHTLQSAPGEERLRMARAAADLVQPHGMLISVCLGRTEGTECADAAPPFRLTRTELESLMSAVGLEPIAPVDEFDDENERGEFMNGATGPSAVRRLRGVFKRAGVTRR